MSAVLGFLEDEEFQVSIVKSLFSKAGYHIRHASTLGEMRELIDKHAFDLLLLDLMLPDGMAHDLIKQIRSDGLTIPIIVLSAIEEETEIVHALNLGADDYVIKPMQSTVMLARVASHLRRNRGLMLEAPLQAEEKISFRDDQCILNGKSISLSEKEMMLASFLVSNRGKLVSRQTLMKEVWGISAELHTRTVDTHISRLRKKIEKSSKDTIRITGVHGLGYRLEILADV